MRVLWGTECARLARLDLRRARFVPRGARLSARREYGGLIEMSPSCFGIELLVLLSAFAYVEVFGDFDCIA